uniref:HAT C-terminal dimerisation domain-containing protein n=1 Tax=Arundo donax TaxID=35708 RepID=A0A0A9BHB4_ARUDO
MQLLICISALNPLNSFASYDKDQLINLAKFYPKEFATTDLTRLSFQLDNFIDDMRSDNRFNDLKTLGELSVKLVETQKHLIYNLVYLLLKLVLLLPVATASVERVFSAMTFVKNKLRNRMGDQLLNDCLVTFIERDMFLRVSVDDVIKRFQSMGDRRVKLKL